MGRKRSFVIMISSGTVVLDAPAGSAYYKGLYQNTKYESADFEQVDKENA